MTCRLKRLAPFAQAHIRQSFALIRPRRAQGSLATTLAKYASVGGGPGYQKSRRTPLYPTVELDRWADERLGELRGSTSEG